MKKLLILAVLLFKFTVVFAQNDPPPRAVPAKTPPPVPANTPLPKISPFLLQNYEQNKNKEITREEREQAYLKLIEGQKFMYGSATLRSQASVNMSLRFARQAFQKAVEQNPNLTEGYVGLAETFIKHDPPDADEAITAGQLAIKTNPQTYGGRRYLAIAYLIKSNLGEPKFDVSIAQKAIQEWKEITEMEPSDAESWAWLSILYEYTKQDEERIFALKNWLAASPSVENSRFAPQNAVFPLSDALIKAGEYKDAVVVLRNALLSDNDSQRIVTLLAQTTENIDVETASTTIEFLQRALYDSPDDTDLLKLLAIFQARAGKIEDSVKTVNNVIKKLSDKDVKQAAEFQVVLGDIYNSNNNGKQAITAYFDALKLRGIGTEAATTDDERNFAMSVFNKIINNYKALKDFDNAKKTIDQASLVLGKDDLFIGNQLINLYKEFGRKNDAISVVREIRERFAKNKPANSNLMLFDEYYYYRLEASLLTEFGRVGEAVSLLKSLLNGKPTGNGLFTDFDIYLLISNNYLKANDGKNAIENAKQALTLASNTDKKERANLVLASSLNQAGDFKSAETILRDIIKQNPQSSIALNNLGYFLTEQNIKLEEALGFIKHAVKIEPQNAMYLDSLGWVNFKLGKLEEAEKHLKQAVKIEPNAMTILDHLGDVYFKQGKTELAKTTWQKAISLSSDDVFIAKLKLKLDNKKP
jgi:tetratricopeptide (TPR) repeat protein